jgi:peptide/nickel transport system substrate-binding protein
MTFHDGEPVTADDAVFTLATAIAQQPPAMSSRISNLAGVAKVDDYTFDVQLKTPDASFVTTVLTYLFIVPEHIWSGIDGEVFEWDPVAANAVIGSGPFKYKTWRMNELQELETHRDHFHAPAYDGIRRLALGQSDAIRAAMLDGTADVATTVLPVAAMSDLAAQEEFLEFQEIPSHGTLMAWVNNAGAPYTDKAFRRALRMATSKRRAAVEGWLGFAVEAGEGNVPRQLGKWHNADLPEIPFDIEGARAILAEAGYGWDSDGRLHYPKQ